MVWGFVDQGGEGKRMLEGVKEEECCNRPLELGWVECGSGLREEQDWQ